MAMITSVIPCASGIKSALHLSTILPLVLNCMGGDNSHVPPCTAQAWSGVHQITCLCHSRRHSPPYWVHVIIPCCTESVVSLTQPFHAILGACDHTLLYGKRCVTHAPIPRHTGCMWSYPAVLKVLAAMHKNRALQGLEAPYYMQAHVAVITLLRSMVLQATASLISS
eukprot:scaffold273052_cov18-Tisochrysis_lutea.AAC.1